MPDVVYTVAITVKIPSVDLDPMDSEYLAGIGNFVAMNPVYSTDTIVSIEVLDVKRPVLWTPEHAEAARVEGWCISNCGEHRNGEWQVQKWDELDILPDDQAAWKIIAHGIKPHHFAAMEFLRNVNMQEAVRILNTRR